jgi:hypothetical protein
MHGPGGTETQLGLGGRDPHANLSGQVSSKQGMKVVRDSEEPMRGRMENGLLVQVPQGTIPASKVAFPALGSWRDGAVQAPAISVAPSLYRARVDHTGCSLCLPRMTDSISGVARRQPSV